MYLYLSTYLMYLSNLSACYMSNQSRNFYFVDLVMLHLRYPVVFYSVHISALVAVDTSVYYNFVDSNYLLLCTEISGKGSHC